MLVLLAITGLGLALRLPDFLAYWLNPDEGICFSAATWPTWAGFWTQVSTNAHPPLFFLIVRGAAAVSQEIGVLRLPALVSGVLAIPAFFLLGRAMGGTAAGLISALLVAVAPGAILLSQLIRPYTTQVAVLALVFWLFARFAATRSRRALGGFALLLTIAVLLHYSSWLMVGVTAGVGAALIASRRLSGREAASLAAAHVPAVLAIAALWLLHVSPLVADGRHLRNARETWLSQHFHDDPFGLWGGLLGLTRYWFGPGFESLALLLVLVGIGVLVVRRELVPAAVATLSLVAAAAFSLLAFHPLGESRHSLYLMVPLVPCAAVALDWSVVGRRPRHLAAAAGLLVLVVYPAPLEKIMGTAAFPSRRHVEHVTPRASVEAAQPFLAATRASDEVVFLDEQTYFALIPLFHPARLEVDTRSHAELAGVTRVPTTVSHMDQDASASHFPWGSARVVVAHSWRLRADRRRMGDADHVLGFLRMADRAFPDLEIGESRAGSLLFAGWGARFYQPLGRMRGGCVSDFALREGLGWSKIDPAACLARLE